ncbi:MAG: cob(I)yrinic acid a,c-diamide adenosyltransferase [Bacteroidota bacterium]
MKVYTKKGDGGQTSLIGGTRVPKHHLRIDAYGTVDELNSTLGRLGDFAAVGEHLPFLREIQDRLFTMGSQLAADPEKNRMELPSLRASDVEKLEKGIDQMEEGLEPLRNFILPGGHPANSTAHVARCICRRAERLVVNLSERTAVDPLALQYLNRLSDWLFVFAREMSRATGSTEIVWRPRED